VFARAILNLGIFYLWLYCLRKNASVLVVTSKAGKVITFNLNSFLQVSRADFRDSTKVLFNKSEVIAL